LLVNNIDNKSVDSIIGCLYSDICLCQLN